MTEVIWSRKALRQLAAIEQYVSRFRPLAAQRLAVRIIASTDDLRLFPETGRAIGRGRRQIVAVDPYVIRYRYDGTTVAILEVRHGATLAD
jgi:toxin ParE1/3/4